MEILIVVLIAAAVLVVTGGAVALSRRRARPELEPPPPERPAGGPAPPTGEATGGAPTGPDQPPAPDGTGGAPPAPPAPETSSPGASAPAPPPATSTPGPPAGGVASGGGAPDTVPGAQPGPAPAEGGGPAAEAGGPGPEGAGAPGEQAAPVPGEPPPSRPSFRERLSRARSLLAGYVSSVLSRDVDAATFDELEEALIRADVGVETTTALLEELRAGAEASGVRDPAELLATLRADIERRLGSGDPDRRRLRFDEGVTNVWLFVGVNGVGKTTTIGKVAHAERQRGRTVLLAAGDTFRAAAAEQLELWGERVGVPVVRGAEGADPASVIYDAVQSAAARGIDLVLADTAGRLHTKTNLMAELAKVRRVADRPPGRVTEVLLVLDATVGQNGLIQARQFTEATDVTGVVLTKLDGSAKGGIVLAIEDQLGIPVKLVGLGEGPGDLVAFDPHEFVEALLNPA